MLRFALVLSLLSSLLAGSAGAEPRLELLGILPEHEAESLWERGVSMAFGVSADGCTIVGGSESRVEPRVQPVRWTEGIIEALPMAPEATVGWATDVSADGSVVVGWERDTLTLIPVWHAVVVWEDGEIVDTIEDGYRAHLSAGGDVLVYTLIHDLYDFADRTASFRREGGIDTDLGVLPGGSLSTIAEDVSADGSVVVGAGKAADGAFEAFRWEDGVMSPLGRLPGQPDSRAYGVSADGTTVVGESGDRAFRWKDGVLSDLGPGLASAVSADGATVAGRDRPPGQDPFTSFIWTEEEGWRTLQEFATNELGLDPTIVYSFGSLGAMSPDARVIVGSAHPPSFMLEAYALWVDDSGCLPDRDADGDGYGDACDFAAEIDVQPSRRRNFIDLASQEPLAVALLGSENFDATQVEISTLAFAPTGPSRSTTSATPSRASSTSATSMVTTSWISCSTSRSPKPASSPGTWRPASTAPASNPSTRATK